MVAPRNQAGAAHLIAVVQDPADPRLPAVAREALAVLVAMLGQLSDRIGELDRKVREWHRGHAVSRRLAAIPGVGPLTATALTAALGDGRQFESGRQFGRSSDWCRARRALAGACSSGGSRNGAIPTCGPT